MIEYERELGMRKNLKYGPFKPTLNDAEKRQESILKNTASQFNINEADSISPLGKKNSLSTFTEEIGKDAKALWNKVRTRDVYGWETVQRFDTEIMKHAGRYKIDPDMTRAVMYAENARGYYGSIADKVGMSESILPMNIQKKRWSAIIGREPKDLNDPDTNIEAGTVLLQRIRDRIIQPTPAKIASIWHSLGATKTDEFGEYVGHIYREKPWRKIDRP